MSVIEVTPNKCKLCYACIRACPTKAIKAKDGHVEIIEERCVNCGSCVNVCAPEALHYKSSKKQVEELIKGEDKVAAIVGPSISGEFVDITDYRNFVGMIKALGFKYVNEVSFGVDIVARAYKQHFKDFKGKYRIATNCPVVPAFVEKFYPGLVKNLSEIVSPWAATAEVVHKEYGDDTRVVYIGPCVAAKEEAKSYEGKKQIDEVLTFEELREMFEEKEVTENNVEIAEFDPPIGGKGSLFPISSGLTQSVGMQEDLLEENLIITEGKENLIKSIREFRHSNELKQHLNPYYCGGCIMGPGTSQGGAKYTRRSLVIKYVKKRLKNHDEKAWQNNLEKYKSLDLSRNFQPNDQRLPFPSEAEIQEELDAIGKGRKREQLGCGACGYSSCREFAIAIKQGLAQREMCSYFSIRKMHTYINEIDRANEKLQKTQKALRDSERKAKKEHMAAKEALETNKTMLQKLPTAVVLVDENLQVVDANRSFVDILGEEAKELDEVIPGLVGADLKTLLPFHKYFSSVLKSGQDITNRDTELNDKLVNASIFTIKKNKVVGGIIRDLYSPEVRKDEVINRAKDVIRENLETVQQIAFLLGESASKTEKTLNSIIQAYNPNNDAKGNRK